MHGHLEGQAFLADPEESLSDDQVARELETGRNSVSPCRSPRNSASRQSTPAGASAQDPPALAGA